MSPQVQNKVVTPAIRNDSIDIETGVNNNVVNNMKSGHANHRGNRRRLWLYILLGFVTVLVVAAMVVVAVVVAAGGGSDAPLTPQQQQLSEIAKSVSRQKDLQNSASPQNMAYHWLIHQDEFANDSSLPKELIVQRYVLAVFYYATMGHQNWETASNWLEGSECLDNWFGISCNDQGQVRTLKFGKSSQQ